MPTSAFFSVLRDVTKLASAAADDLASQSIKLSSAADDIATLTGKAASKTAGVAGDDLAVGAGQMGGMSPARELPAIWKIAKASLLNKVWLSIVLLVVSALYPPAITVALILGGLYLAYEGGEGLLEKFHPPSLAAEFQPLSEEEKVRGAIRTDLVLSLEILVISLAAAGEVPLSYQAMVLAIMSVLMTVAVYGLIALIIRLDDMGLSLAKSGRLSLTRSLGTAMAHSAPIILKALDPIGMFAMFAVAGGIFAHQVHLAYPHWAVELLANVLIGAGVGLLLAGLHSLGHKLRAKRA